MEVNIKRLNSNVTLPTKAHETDAGWDLYANIPAPITIYPHDTAMIPTGFAIEIPEGYFGGIYARSGLSSKEGLRPANCTGVIDSSYRGEVMIALHNDSEYRRYVQPNERIGQMIIQPFLTANLKEVSTLSDTERGEGGFGSTGT